MTSGAWAWLAVASVVAVGDWIAAQSGRRRLEYVCKPLTMVALIAVALSLEPSSEAARVWFVVASAFSLAGDVFLMLPQDLFVPGLASFLIGHLAYIGGLRALGTTAGALAVGLVVVLAGLVVVGMPVVRAVRAGERRAMAAPVVAYIVVISVMVASAVGTGIALAATGAVLFYCSDSLIVWTRFVRPLRNGPLAIIVTYHLAQIGLVLSLAV